MKLLVKLLIVFSLLCNFCYADTQADVQAAYQNWCRQIGLAKGNPDAILKLYAPDAILLSTFAPNILYNRKGDIRDYFATLTRYPEIQCVPEKLVTQILNGVAVNSGFYHFSYLDADGKVVNIPARFTFVYQHENKEWLIINHHSSEMPKK